MDVNLNETWTDTLEDIRKWVHRETPWDISFEQSSISNCDVEIVATIKPTGLGLLWPGGPRHAHLFICSGPVTTTARDRLLQAYRALPEPKYVIALGTRAVSSASYHVCPDVVVHIDEVLPVEVYVLGFPPRPGALIDGVSELLRELKHLRLTDTHKTEYDNLPAEVLRRTLSTGQVPTHEEMMRDRTLADRPPH
ncbi:MAG: NADH-quinone oxidoreductase subunit B [Ardenticatenaceae bacterium]|nr:NADH-quinone oxidoreductase subunit B [Anaerolineales bacterium]MCB8916591.1 NADH-quinone oxidoreductase subunit B [Ardenticatenaceae bacterium]